MVAPLAARGLVSKGRGGIAIILATLLSRLAYIAVSAQVLEVGLGPSIPQSPDGHKPVINPSAVFLRSSREESSKSRVSSGVGAAASLRGRAMISDEKPGVWGLLQNETAGTGTGMQMSESSR